MVARPPQTDIASLPTYDISNEAWREYIYPNGDVLRVEKATQLILEKRPDGDRHRLVIEEKHDGPHKREIGMYVKPGWLGIRWQTPSGEHGITF